MKTLIAYATKNGFTKKCAEMLATKIKGGADIINLAERHPDISQYENVVIGGSVYMGKIRKPVRKFCEKNLNELKKKKLGLFTCGIANDDEAKKQLESSFPQELLDCTTAKEFFGGELEIEKQGALMRFFLKKNPVETNTKMRTESIDKMAELID